MGKHLQKTIICLLLCAAILASNCHAVFATGIDALTDGQAAQNEYVSEEAAVLQLRQQLKERTSEIVLYFKTSTCVEDSTWYDLFSQAIAHTGASTEGDYILFHLSGFSATCSAQLIDGLYYVCVSYSVNYYSTKEQEDALNSAFDAVMQQLDLSNKTPYQKISAIYDYITTNISYDYPNKDNHSHFEKLTAYGALVKHTCVCQGYANLFYRMALSVGIDCRIISGIGNGERHAWNIVCLDGKYYNVDCTWDAEQKQSGYGYANFLKSEASFADHTRDEQYTLDAFCTDYPISETDYTETSYEFVDGDFVFQIADGQATLTAYTGNSTEVTIPDTADGVPVRFVGNEAFFNNSSIQSVVIPSPVLEIDAGWLDSVPYPYVPHGAFAGCTNLTAVLFTESSQLRRIGDWTFADCVNLKHISLPNSIRRLELSCFETCSSLESIVLPEGLEFIGQNALSYTALKTLHIPASCTEFHNHNTMQNLESFSVSHGNRRYSTHEGVLYDSAFQPGHITLVHYPIMKPESAYRIPDFCTSINTDSFCTGQTPENLKVLYIGNLVHAFSLAAGFDPFSRVWCTVIPDETNQRYTSTDGMLFTKDGKTLVQVARNGEKTITVPNGVEFLNGYLFFQDKALEEVILPGSVAEIGSSAFSETGLKHITLPSTVTHIGSFAFAACKSLTAVYFLGDVPTVERNVFYITGTNAFYPLDNVTWVNVDTSNWGGAVTLRPFCNDKQHSYTDDITHPTCTENGYTTYTCACGDTYTDNTVTKLGHDMGQWTVVKEATPSAKGEEKRICSRCDYAETRELEYKGPGDDETIKVKHNLTLESAIDFSFYVPKSAVAERGLTATVVQDRADGYEDKTITLNQADWETLTSGGVDYWRIRYTDVAAKELTDLLTLTIQDASGIVVTDTYSVAAYAADRIENSANSNMKNLMNVLLHYGAAAQVYFNYRTDALANAGMAAPAAVTLAAAANAGAAVKHNLTLESNIDFSFFVPKSAVDASGLTATVVHDRVEGFDDKTVTLDQAAWESFTSGGVDYWRIRYTDVAAKEIGDTLKLTVSNGTDAVVVDSCSVLQYAQNRVQNSSNENMKALMQTLQAYGAAAQLYFNYK